MSLYRQRDPQEFELDGGNIKKEYEKEKKKIDFFHFVNFRKGKLWFVR